MDYTMHIAGLERHLPLCPLNDKLQIAAFIMFGDVKLTVAAARELLKKAPAFDGIITAESKGIPLAYEMTRQADKERYIVARKGKKLYMRNVVSTQVDSITTAAHQVLMLDGEDIEWMRGKRILIVDDVISTGESLSAIERIVNVAQGIIVGRMAVLAEGDAAKREDILYLEKLPLFDNDGSAIE